MLLCEPDSTLITTRHIQSILIDIHGLEATISYPKPDLVITNPTPFGVLIWNSWTDESITVDIYSTTNVQVTLEEPTETPVDQCSVKLNGFEFGKRVQKKPTTFRYV